VASTPGHDLLGAAALRISEMIDALALERYIAINNSVGFHPILIL
jgi:hypothetical protein